MGDRRLAADARRAPRNECVVAASTNRTSLGAMWPVGQRPPLRSRRVMARRGQSRAARRATSTSSGGSGLPSTIGIAPLVEPDRLGQQLGAVAVGVAGDRVDEDADHVGPPVAGVREPQLRGAVPMCTRRAVGVASHVGGEDVSALRTRLTAPSG